MNNDEFINAMLEDESPPETPLNMEEVANTISMKLTNELNKQLESIKNEINNLKGEMKNDNNSKDNERNGQEDTISNDKESGNQSDKES